MAEKLTALVTGGGGFIGAHLCIELVKNGIKVYSFNRRDISTNKKFNEYLQTGDIVLIKGDITTYDFSTLPKVDYIYHVAGKVSVWGSEDSFMLVNYYPTVALLNFAKENKVKCFTYFSSVAVYGFKGYANLTEEAEKIPSNNGYSISKLKTEKYLKEYCTSNKLNYVIIRPGNVYGEYDYTSSHEIYTRVKKQKMCICASGKYKSCFVYVGNLVKATLHTSLNQKYNNTDYNVTDGNHETLKEYLSAIAMQFGVKPKFSNFPAPLAKFVAQATEIFYKIFRIKKTPLITQFSIYQNCADYDFDISKLLSTGYKKTYSQAEGIKNTVVWINQLDYKKQSDKEALCKSKKNIKM